MDKKFVDKSTPLTWTGMDAWVAAICFNTIEAEKHGIPAPMDAGFGRGAQHGRAGDIAPAAAMGMMIFYTNALARMIHLALSRGVLARTQAWRVR